MKTRILLYLIDQLLDHLNELNEEVLDLTVLIKLRLLKRTLKDFRKFF